jgi:hypothetical protein
VEDLDNSERARVPIEQDAKHYTRFRAQVDAALDRLKCDAVFADWRYSDGTRIASNSRLVQAVAPDAYRGIEPLEYCRADNCMQCDRCRCLAPTRGTNGE